MGLSRIPRAAYDYNSQGYWEGHVRDGEIYWKSENVMPNPCSAEEQDEEDSFNEYKTCHILFDVFSLFIFLLLFLILTCFLFRFTFAFV